MNEADNPDLSPEAKFLFTNRDMILDGRSVFGDPTNHRAVEKLAEINARIEFGRLHGTIPRAPEPWSTARVARETLAKEFPAGEPAPALPEALREFTQARIDKLASLDDRVHAHLADAVLADIGHHGSRVTFPHAAYSQTLGRMPSGSEVVTALLADAEPVIQAMSKTHVEAEQTRKALRADRQLLENFAERGQIVNWYAARKQALGLDH